MIGTALFLGNAGLAAFNLWMGNPNSAAFNAFVAGMCWQEPAELMLAWRNRRRVRRIFGDLP
mgnify:CR=1 FL=1